MRNLIKFFVAAFLFWGCSFATVQAQEASDEPVFLMVDYMKVKPGMQEDYLALEKVWKKIHKLRIDAEASEGWYFYRVVSPSGSNAEYDFVTYNRLVGVKQMAGVYENPFVPAGAEKALTAEEMALVQRTGEIRDIVKSEVWRARDWVFAEDFLKAKIEVFNYFKLKPGKTRADHASVEIDIWKPVHKARIDAGKMKGWGILSLAMPYGTDVPYQDATIDIYQDMTQFMMPYQMTDFFEKVHKGKDIEALMSKISTIADLTSGEVRMMIDYIE